MSWRLNHFMHGITQGYMAERHFLASPECRESTLRIAETGCDVVALVVNQFQADLFATEIGPDNEHTVSDEVLMEHIRFLHELGYGVMLKPMVDPLDSTWRGNITLRRGGGTLAWRTSDRVTPWFDSYWRFIRRYAEIAEATRCEMLCLGCELQGMEDHNRDWCDLVDRTREVYHGLVTYNMGMNIHEFFRETRGWFCKLDLLGMSGYFWMTESTPLPTYQQVLENWRGWRDRLARFHDWVGRPLFFAETGARPLEGTANAPAGFREQAKYSAQQQVDFYEALHETFEPDDWFYGTVWWKHDEHQPRPNFKLADGHYIGFEPTELLKERMRERSAHRPDRQLILPNEL